MFNKGILRKLFHPESFAFLLLFFGSLLAVYYPLAVHISQTPTGTIYTYAQGYLPDYYQYLGWVKDGMMGNLLLSSRHTEVVYPRSFVHTMFPVVGLIGNIFGLPSYSSYTVTRFFSNIFFLFTFAYLVRKFFSSKLERSISYILLLVTTGVWSLDPTGNLIEAIHWSGNFNAVGKFFLPPHHLFSLSFLMLAVIKLTMRPLSGQNISLIAVLIIVGGLLNPGLLLFFFIFFTISMVVHSLPFKGLTFKGIKKHFPFVLIFLSVTGGILLYNSYLFQTTMPWSRMYTLMRGFNPAVSFSAYLYALGPILVPALLALTNSKIRNSYLGKFLFTWGFLPLACFHFLGNPLPMNASRLFQSYQYIPLAVLGAIGTVQIALFFLKLKIPGAVSIGCIIIWFCFYSITPFLKGMESIIEPVKPWYFNEYVPLSAMRTFNVLDTKTPRESVVLASETVSTMIPAFTHNRVLLGRDDVAPDYYEKRDKAFAMLDGKFTETEAMQYLTNYKVNYILFGLDAQQFQNTKNTAFPFLKVFYQDESITLVQVSIN